MTWPRSSASGPRSNAPERAGAFATASSLAGEQAYCERRGKGKYQSYAARFAAKEATMKALGRGWGRVVGWRDVEVVRQPGSRPEIVLHGKAKAFAAEQRIRGFHLALTHTATLAEAQVIAEL